MAYGKGEETPIVAGFVPIHQQIGDQMLLRDQIIATASADANQWFIIINWPHMTVT